MLQFAYDHGTHLSVNNLGDALGLADERQIVVYGREREAEAAAAQRLAEAQREAEARADQEQGG